MSSTPSNIMRISLLLGLALPTQDDMWNKQSVNAVLGSLSWSTQVKHNENPALNCSVILLLLLGW